MRFHTIIDNLPKVKILAEIGCDHAKLTRLALLGGKCEQAIVSDISSDCLSKARYTLNRFENVTYKQCDGLDSEHKTADLLLICGLGGHTICNILKDYNGKAILALSPQSHAELVRQKIMDISYKIETDFTFMDAGKFYDLIIAVNGNETLSPMQICYGKYYKQKNEALAMRMEKIKSKLKGSESKNFAKIEEVTEVLEWQK